MKAVLVVFLVLLTAAPVFAGPPANPALRAALEEQASREGTSALHQRLLTH